MTWQQLPNTKGHVLVSDQSSMFLSQPCNVSDYGMMAAGAMITSLPTLLLIFFGQKRLQEGMTKGALK